MWSWPKWANGFCRSCNTKNHLFLRYHAQKEVVFDALNTGLNRGFEAFERFIGF